MNIIQNEASRKAKKQEYATKLTLMGIFLSIFAGFVTRLSRISKTSEMKIQPFDLVLLGFSTLRLGRLVSYDLVVEPLRQPFTKTVLDDTGAGDTVKPRGEGVRQSIGQLIACPICAGTWIAAGLVYGLFSIPGPTRVFLAINGTMGLTEVLNALTEALSWSGQLARTLSGAKDESRPDDSFSHLFNTGGKYYVRQDHEKHYSQGRR